MAVWFSCCRVNIRDIPIYNENMYLLQSKWHMNRNFNLELNVGNLRLRNKLIFVSFSYNTKVHCCRLQRDKELEGVRDHSRGEAERGRN